MVYINVYIVYMCVYKHIYNVIYIYLMCIYIYIYVCVVFVCIQNKWIFWYSSLVTFHVLWILMLITDSTLAQVGWLTAPPQTERFLFVYKFCVPFFSEETDHSAGLLCRAGRHQQGQRKWQRGCDHAVFLPCTVDWSCSQECSVHEQWSGGQSGRPLTIHMAALSWPGQSWLLF